MTVKQANDFQKWLGEELVPYMEDNNIHRLEDVSLERAIEEAKWSEYVALNWIEDGYDDDGEYKQRLRGARKFLKKYATPGNTTESR